VVVLPVIRELTGRGHRVRALVCDFGRADRLQAAGVETTTNAAVFDAFLGASGPRLFLNAADCMALCGDEDARYYAKMGLDPRRLVVTGAPAFDHLATARAGGGGMAGKGVTIFGQGQTWVGPRSTLGHAPDAWCEELARLYRVLCRHFPDAPLRVKPHPAEAAHGIAALYERAVPADLAGRVQMLANADDNNAQLILDSALVVSFSSSVWLEARFLGRTAAYFSLRPRSGRAGAELDALGGTWIPGRGLDLTARLEPHLDRLAQRAREPAPADENVLRRYVGPPDGRAAARAASRSSARSNWPAGTSRGNW